MIIGLPVIVAATVGAPVLVLAVTPLSAGLKYVFAGFVPGVLA